MTMFKDIDTLETREWLDSIDSVIKYNSRERAAYLIKRLAEHAGQAGVSMPSAVSTPYRNTIALEDEAKLPGDINIERRIRAFIHWNTLVMVNRANQNDDGLGGHIASYSSSATLYEVGFNYFFRGNDGNQLGDMVYFQGHCAPGIYARSFMEGRFTEKQLDNFRREVHGEGLSSYPHPWLMPDYWQFPTVSMGLGPITAIYQAHVMRYLTARGITPDTDRKVWAFLGDGECDEPESLGAISLAGREQLDNLIFVVNCNLQRLDGPVRGNGKIVQELESAFRGAGWNVIKVLWGGRWDPLLEKDTEGFLQKRMDEVCDGELQNCKANGGAYTREYFFGKYPELDQLVSHLSDDQIMSLNRGGHDPQKVYAAYHAAVNHTGSPTVILAQTVKGYGLGDAGESANTAHNIKKVGMDELRTFRDRFKIPVTDEELETIPYYRPSESSEEIRYLQARRKQLNGYLPERRHQIESLQCPNISSFQNLLQSSGDRQISTTMSFVRYLAALTKDKHIGHRVVPIVPDEARTFGMEGMFRQLGIYSSEGQRYIPHDRDQIMYYKEDKQGQILEEGLNEAGAMSAWINAATAYSNYGEPMVPFYIYYSMFGFQRIGDLAWLAGDAQARGFLIGATSGRTTLNGEGLQHQDGHSHLLASTIPNCISYDPTYSYELAVIITEGLRRMYDEQENIFYYITTMNENYVHPAMPSAVEEGIIKGIYPLNGDDSDPLSTDVQLMGAGSILREVEAAAKVLREQYNVNANVWSVTSINELAKEGRRVDRWNFLNPDKPAKKAFLTTQLEAYNGPFIIATDYVKNYAEQLRKYVPGNYYVLGTDGYGRSDTRPNLRNFFEVDRHHIIASTLSALHEKGDISTELLLTAMQAHNINPDKAEPISQ